MKGSFVSDTVRHLLILLDTGYFKLVLKWPLSISSRWNFSPLLLHVSLRISWILEIFIKNSSDTSQQCPDSIACLLTRCSYTEGRTQASKWVSYCCQSPKATSPLIAFCPVVTIFTSFLPGSDYTSPRLFLLQGDYGTTCGVFTLQEQKVSPIFVQASHLVNATGLGQLWILVIHGWLSQELQHGAAALRSLLTWCFP